MSTPSTDTTDDTLVTTSSSEPAANDVELLKAESEHDTSPPTSDDLRRTDASFARILANHSSDQDVLAWGHTRGLLPRTLQSWGMTVVEPTIIAVGYDKDCQVKPYHAGDLFKAGLLVDRKRTEFEPPKLTGTSKHDNDAPKDQRPELGGCRWWLGGRVSWALRDHTGLVRSFIGRWSDDSKTMRELAGDFEGDEVFVGRDPGEEPAKYLGLRKERWGKSTGSSREVSTYPIQLSPQFIARCSGLEFADPKTGKQAEAEGDKPKRSKYDKLKDKSSSNWICEGYLDGVAVSQAGTASISLGGCETHDAQVKELVRLLDPFMEFSVPIYLCLDADPPNAHARGKRIALGAGQRGVCDLLRKIRVRDHEMARLIRVVDLSGQGAGGKVDLADLLKEIYLAHPKPSTGNAAADLLAFDGWQGEVVAAQASKLRELEGQAVDQVEFACRLHEGVKPEDETAYLKETGLWDLAGRDSDLFLARSQQIGATLGKKAREIESWAKRVVKAAKKDAEAAPQEFSDDPLEEFTEEGTGRRRPEHECLRRILEIIDGSLPDDQKLWWDEFSLLPRYLGGQEMSDHLLAELRRRIACEFSCHVKEKSHLRQAIEDTAHERPRHPVREYLQGLTWDGEDRIPLVLEQVLGVKLESENQRRLYTAFLRRWMIAGCARAFASKENPVKADNVLVLAGPQDRRKSSFFETLVPVAEWFDAPDISDFSDNAAIKLAGLWIAEMAESNGSSYWKDIEKQKAWLSKRKDRIIRKYVAFAETFPRGYILGATVNEKQYQADSSGFRRQHCMWVDAVINIELLAEIRDQIWAQAFVAFRAGEQHWLTEEEKALHLEDGQQFQVADFERDKIEAWLAEGKKREVTSLEICEGLKLDKPTTGDSRRIIRHLAALGWAEVRVNGRRVYRHPAGKLEVVGGDPTPPKPDPQPVFGAVTAEVAAAVSGILDDLG